MSLQLNDEKHDELENLNEVMSVEKRMKKKNIDSEKSEEEVVLETLKEVITFDVPVIEMQVLNE